MIQVIRAEKRYKHESDWLSSYWLFSFADYVDKNNISFGNLRVCNDDTIKPGKGFKRHEHQNMEIVTIPLRGALTHSDSIGNKIMIHPGDVQIISAGVGISHAEMNLTSEETRFLQLWFLPSVKNVTPTYSQKSYSATTNLIPLVSGEDKAILKMNADATVYAGSLLKGEKINYLPNKERKIFLYVFGGSIQFDNVEAQRPKFDYRDERRPKSIKLILQEGDHVRITEKESINLISQDNAKFILVDTG